MEDIEYVRVRGGDPLVRFQAEYAERWEDLQIMEFKNFVFEQMEDGGETINAEGWAGAAVVQTGSGNISLDDGVKIDIKSEDIIIRTASLEWIDNEKHLLGREGDEVEIESSEGTSFLGIGFSADARNRTWAFSGRVEGKYVESEDDDDSEEHGVRIEWRRDSDDSIISRPRQYSHEEQAPQEQLSQERVPQEQATGESTPGGETVILQLEEK